MKSFYRMENRQPFIRNFDRLDEVTLVGGKGQSLQMLRSIGAPVPDGLILTAFFCAAFENGTSSLSAQCHDALQQVRTSLGPGSLIVRSSAVGEDSEAAAFAGYFQWIRTIRAPSSPRFAIA
jgi:phosphoenolpyruvate synthase/pyruvate phosphate dikinase